MIHRLDSWRLMLIAAFVAVIFGLSACASLGVPAPQTFDQRLAVATSTVTSLRNTATTLLTAKKMTVSDAENIQAQADNVMAGVQIARVVAVSDPAAADAKLRQTMAVLTALQAYLMSKEPTK